MIRILISWLLFVCLSLPTVAKLSHALDGHIRIECNEDIPNHIHQAEFDCEFHKYHIVTPLEASCFLWEPYQFAVNHRPLIYTVQGVAGDSPRFYSLRAPPV